MKYAPRGFDRVVQVFFLICCLPCVYGEGGFCWKWGAETSQSCSTVCTNAGLLCVKKFDKVGSQAAFQEAGGGVVCSSYNGGSWSGHPAKYNGICIYQTGSTGDCTSSNPAYNRLCSCQCAAGTFSNSDLKSWPCEE